MIHEKYHKNFPCLRQDKFKLSLGFEPGTSRTAVCNANQGRQKLVNNGWATNENQWDLFKSWWEKNEVQYSLGQKVGGQMPTLPTLPTQLRGPCTFIAWGGQFKALLLY